MLAVHCPIHHTRMLFRQVPWKALWKDGSLYFVYYGLRYLVIVLANALLALAWLALSVVCLFNSLIGWMCAVQPVHRTANPVRAGYDQRLVRRKPQASARPHTRKGNDSSRRSSPSPPNPKHVSFIAGRDSERLPRTKDISPLTLSPRSDAENNRTSLAHQLVPDIADNGESTNSTTQPSEPSLPLSQPIVEFVEGNPRSASPEAFSTEDSRKCRALCKVTPMRRPAAEPSRVSLPRPRTNPYQAPYNFPTPLSPEADNYIHQVRAERQGISPVASPSRPTPPPRPTEDLPRPRVSVVPLPPVSETARSARPALRREDERPDEVVGEDVKPPGREDLRQKSLSPPRSKNGGKKQLQLFKALSNNGRRSSAPIRGSTPGGVSSPPPVVVSKKSSRNSSGLKRILSRSHDDDMLRESFQLEGRVHTDGREDHKGQENRRHSWHSVFHPRRSLSVNSQNSSSVASEPRNTLPEVEESPPPPPPLSPRQLKKDKRRSR